MEPGKWQYYQERFYDYQTTARGLLTPAQLVTAFEVEAVYFEEYLQHWLPKDKLSLCLDIPCGYGNFLYYLRKAGYQNCLGYDLDPKQVVLACSIGLPARCDDAFAVLAEQDCKIALIASIDFLEHLDKNSAVRFLESCIRGLEPGGTLILRIPCADGPFGSHDRYNDITHEWGVTSNALRCLLGMAGFVSVEFIDPLPVRRGFLGVARWAVSKLMRKIANLLLRLMYVTPPNTWARSIFVVARKP